MILPRLLRDTVERRTHVDFQRVPVGPERPVRDEHRIVPLAALWPHPVGPRLEKEPTTRIGKKGLIIVGVDGSGKTVLTKVGPARHRIHLFPDGIESGQQYRHEQ